MNVRGVLLICLTCFYSLHAMQPLAITGSDGVSVRVDKTSWCQLSGLIAPDCDTALVPIAGGSVHNVDEWLVRMPATLCLADGAVDADFVCEVLQLRPPLNALPFHWLAQCVAYQYKRTYEVGSAGCSFSERAVALQTFLHKFPQTFAQYVNVYFYLLLGGCEQMKLCECFKRLVSEEVDFAIALQDLPETKDQALQRAVIRKNVPYSIYLLTLGASPYQDVHEREHCRCGCADTCSAYMVDVVKPLIDRCKALPAVYKVIEQIEAERKLAKP